MKEYKRKQRQIKQIYRWGFGDVLNAIYAGVEYTHKYGKKNYPFPPIMDLFKKIDNHYKEITLYKKMACIFSHGWNP